MQGRRLYAKLEMEATIEAMAHLPAKKNGCQCPWDLLQLGSLLLFLFYAYVFYFLEAVALQDWGPAVYVLAGIYTGLFVFVLVLDLLAMCADPTDPTIYSEKQALARQYAYLLIS